MKRLIAVLLVLALVGCASFRALPPGDKGLVVMAATIIVGVAGAMIGVAATTPPMTQAQYDAIFGGGK